MAKTVVPGPGIPTRSRNRLAMKGAWVVPRTCWMRAGPKAMKVDVGRDARTVMNWATEKRRVMVRPSAVAAYGVSGKSTLWVGLASGLVGWRGEGDDAEELQRAVRAVVRRWWGTSVCRRSKSQACGAEAPGARKPRAL